MAPSQLFTAALLLVSAVNGAVLPPKRNVQIATGSVPPFPTGSGAPFPTGSGAPVPTGTAGVQAAPLDKKFLRRQEPSGSGFAPPSGALPTGSGGLPTSAPTGGFVHLAPRAPPSGSGFAPSSGAPFPTGSGGLPSPPASTGAVATGDFLHQRQFSGLPSLPLGSGGLPVPTDGADTAFARIFRRQAGGAGPSGGFAGGFASPTGGFGGGFGGGAAPTGGFKALFGRQQPSGTGLASAPFPTGSGALPPFPTGSGAVSSGPAPTAGFAPERVGGKAV